jgi:putative flippase GtrA
MRLKRLLKDYRIQRLVRFFIAGLLATAVDFSVLAVGVEIFKLRPETANIAAFLIAVFVSYFANKYFTFRDSKQIGLKQIIKFFLVSFVGFCLNYAFFVELLQIGFYYISAKLLTIVLVASWNFLINNYWTFAASHFPLLKKKLAKIVE